MGQKKSLAVDSNLLFDLAAKKDFALAFLEVAREKGYTLHLPPTVIQELTFAAFHKHGEETELALVALTNIRVWKIVPFDLIAVGHGITEQFARHLHQLNLHWATAFSGGSVPQREGLGGKMGLWAGIFAFVSGPICCRRVWASPWHAPFY